MIEIKPLDSLTTTRECALKLLEEASEACEVLKEYDKVHEWHTYKDALLELADVAQCMCNCLHTIEAGRGEWEEEVASVRRHNAKRGRHEVDGARTLTVDWGDNG